MIYDVNSPLFRSFLSQKGGSSDKSLFPFHALSCATNDDYVRFSNASFAICVAEILLKMEEQKPKEQRPKASENKPVMTE
ncbi:hypothetical protein GOBAR_DD29164 [Gossypium barbadense]|nr:hypothetical protein GOBAR_DD29164 [Gossypium barbadense]